MSIPQQVADFAQRAASKSTYGGSAVAVFGGLNANEVAAIGGIVVGLAGLAVNIFFKWQHLKLAKKKLEAVEEE